MTENCKLRKAILSAFYNISQRNFGILLILWCSFKLWWNFCWDQNLVYYAIGQFPKVLLQNYLHAVFIYKQDQSSTCPPMFVYSCVSLITSGLRWRIRLSKRLYLWDCGFDSRYGLMTLMWKESVNVLPKVVGYLRVLRFPPTGNVDRVGWDYPPNWPFHRSCAPWSDMSSGF
jgi:hypothetical protein